MTNAKYLACRFGSRLIDARQSETIIPIAIDGPGMRVAGLELVTSLSLWQGNDTPALRSIVEAIDGTVSCGHEPDVEADIHVVSTALGASLQVGVGPMGMYTGKLVLRTTTRETFRELLDRCFTREAQPGFLLGDYTACFLVNPGSGHQHMHTANGGTHDTSKNNHHEIHGEAGHAH